jgi:Icc protein
MGRHRKFGAVGPASAERRKSGRAVRVLLAVVMVLCAGAAASAPADAFRFVILGDRTGEAQPGVYQAVWREANAEDPAFVVSVGDTIQGGNDRTAEAEWAQALKILQPYRRYPLYLTAGNHDIWSDTSEQLFRRHAGHAPHYGFSYANAHFTILDNSRSDQLAPSEMDFLEKDLAANAGQPVKFVFSHRPFWLMDALLKNSDSPFQRLARRYGVRYAIAGHVHQMIRFDVEGVEYVSMPSSGGHLRSTGRYQDGWFFGHLMVEVRGDAVSVRVEETKPPYGQGRTTGLRDWGMLGLVSH